ncbi:UNVERIFIED_CONTAM: hypothetical protein Scaly_0477600 [Sesamum calycinum]|uniref:Secreted protein n=1 Tax=Sesamum calycinum TaxID=2727403 RepID=A0AAW2SF71_9LAMI
MSPSYILFECSSLLFSTYVSQSQASTFWKKSTKHMWSLRRGASTVRSVASTASAIVERDTETKHDQVTFAYNKDPSP